jgi:FtsH-binding integral membrane protein
MDGIFTAITATTLIGLGTLAALDKEEVTTLIEAIYMGIAGLATLVANSQHFVGDSFAESIIKHKIFPVEF